MSISLLLIPLALVLLVLAIAAFFWAVDNDQFEDLDAAGRQILEPEEQRADPPPDR
jgi:cbb3-type cytochrome oxidase maturation protein